MSASGKVLRGLAIILFAIAAALFLSNIGAWLLGRSLSVLIGRIVAGLVLMAVGWVLVFIAQG